MPSQKLEPLPEWQASTRNDRQAPDTGLAYLSRIASRTKDTSLCLFPTVRGATARVAFVAKRTKPTAPGPCVYFEKNTTARVNTAVSSPAAFAVNLEALTKRKGAALRLSSIHEHSWRTGADRGELLRYTGASDRGRSSERDGKSELRFQIPGVGALGCDGAINQILPAIYVGARRAASASRAVINYLCYLVRSRKRAFDSELVAGIPQALISAERRDCRSDQVGLCVVTNEYSKQKSISIVAVITL
ncbi:hypothetical protein ABIF38_009084 [Bradyrhizobium japonicum]